MQFSVCFLNHAVFDQNTVRLIVHMSRFRQSVLRVHPDVPLAMIFNSICEKLKFNDDMKKRLELRHPTQDDVILDLYQSLNHFNLREVYLAEKPGEAADSVKVRIFHVKPLHL